MEAHQSDRPCRIYTRGKGLNVEPLYSSQTRINLQNEVLRVGVEYVDYGGTRQEKLSRS
jgi:hypothetical protein